MPPSSFPTYPSINPIALKCIWAYLTHQRRSLRADAVGLCHWMHPPIVYSGLENLAIQRPFVITANHYARPGFSTAWIAAGISAALPEESVWIMSNQWLFEGNPLGFFLRPVMRFILRSISFAYDLVPMPTMIGGHSTPQERTAGVRETIERVRAKPDSVLCITPEGMDSPDGSLMLPPPGAGRFLLHLQQMGLNVVPTAVYEAGGCLNIRFGGSYRFTDSAGLFPSAIDLAVRQEVMQKIGVLFAQITSK